MTPLLSVDICDVGDVLMCIWRIDGRKPYTWKFFCVVTKKFRHSVRVYRIGARGYANPEMTIPTTELERNVFVLTDNEWPDDVWRERTQLILDGTIDISA